MRTHASSTRLAYAALASAGCLWGTGFLAGKIALRELDVAHMILYRLSFASLGLLPFAILRGVAVRRADWPLVALAALLGVPVMFLVQFQGLALTTVSHAALMIGMAPMLLALGAALFAGERLDRRGWAAIMASTSGATLIVLGAPQASASGGPTLSGDLLVLASLVAATAWVLMSQRLMKRYSSAVVTSTVIILGTLMLAAWVVAVHGAPPVSLSRGTWLAVASQGLLATTLATLLWNWGVAHVPASRAGVFVNLEPVIGALLGVTVLGETLGALGLLGGLFIVGAAIAMSWR
jgi:drug/metabolite transporter (DMT)-like permease